MFIFSLHRFSLFFLILFVLQKQCHEGLEQLMRVLTEFINVCLIFYF